MTHTYAGSANKINPAKISLTLMPRSARSWPTFGSASDHKGAPTGPKLAKLGLREFWERER
jgi:hypothetical protein